MKLTVYEKKVSILFGVMFILMIVSSLVMLNGCGASEVDNKPDSVETVNEQAASGSAVSGESVVVEKAPTSYSYETEEDSSGIIKVNRETGKKEVVRTPERGYYMSVRATTDKYIYFAITKKPGYKTDKKNTRLFRAPIVRDENVDFDSEEMLFELDRMICDVIFADDDYLYINVGIPHHGSADPGVYTIFDLKEKRWLDLGDDAPGGKNRTERVSKNRRYVWQQMTENGCVLSCYDEWNTYAKNELYYFNKCTSSFDRIPGDRLPQDWELESAIDLIMKNKKKINKYMNEYARNYATLIDLDHDGKLELLMTAEPQGSGIYTYNTVFTANTNLDKLVRLKGDIGIEGCSEPDMLADSDRPYYVFLNKNGFYHFIVHDICRAGKNWTGSCYYGMKLSYGKITLESLGSHETGVDAEREGYYGYKDKKINKDDFTEQKLGEMAYKNDEEYKVTLDWQEVKKINKSNEAEFRQSLKDAYYGCRWERVR